jgi:hypothetical protein
MVEAIETKAYGCRFRSRLEARWAVFLTELGLDWDCEREGFVIDGTPYLPDFWLPSIDPECRALGWGLWLEIKPMWPLDEAQESLYAGTAKETGHRLIAVCGGPWNAKAYIFDHHHNGDPISIPLCTEATLHQNRDTGEVVWFSARPRRTQPLAFGSRGDLERAITAARSARFEHGETPAHA